MAKKLSLSFTDRTFNNYLLNYQGNKSAFIEAKFLDGMDMITSELPAIKLELDRVRIANRELQEENRKLKLQVDNYKKKFSDKLPDDVEQLVTMAKSLRAGGINE